MDAAEEQKVFFLLLDEIDETLADFEKRCLRLERSTGPAELKVIFRAAHNIKGGSRLFGLGELGSFVHCVEELLTTLMAVDSPVDPQSIDLLLKSHSLMTEWTRFLRKDRAALMDTSGLCARLEERVRILKTTRGHVPSPGQPRLIPAQPGEDPSPPRVASPVTAPGPLTRAEPPPLEPIEFLPDPPRPRPEARRLSWKGFQPQKRRRTGNLKVSLPRIDEIMQLLGELSIHQSILWHGRTTGTLGALVCQDAVALNQKVLKDLQNLVLTLRMQPVESLFQRLERAARDTARELGKTIQVVLSGSEVQLDRTVSEIMIDPMIHLVRNAVDHGIEPDQRRRELGKPLPSRIEITARQDSGVVILTVGDDGRGIDSGFVLTKAIEKGLISGGHDLSENEIIQLIFAPGFSTRDEVTEISGRGVGMDIVRQAIQQIGGLIVTGTRLGHGTRFQVSVPTSLEVVDSLVIHVAGASYVVPIKDVVEIIDLRSFQLERTGEGAWAINLRGALVPVERLSEYIAVSGAPPAEVGVEDDAIHRETALVILLSDGRKLALAVDRILAQQQIVVRPLSDKLAAIPGFTGATVLGNGEPGLILSMGFIGESYLSWVAKARRSA